MRKRIEEEGASRELSIALTGRMVRWVIQHIRNHDRDLLKCEWLKNLRRRDSLNYYGYCCR